MRDKPLILMVDDDTDFSNIMAIKLKASGFDMVTVNDGQKGIKKAAELVPDLILMDIHMPGMSGTDAALSIKQNPATKDTKIVFLTSLKEPWPALAGDSRAISQGIGMVDFFEKTENLNDLVEKIKVVLQGS